MQRRHDRKPHGCPLKTPRTTALGALPAGGLPCNSVRLAARYSLPYGKKVGPSQVGHVAGRPARDMAGHPVRGMGGWPGPRRAEVA